MSSLRRISLILLAVVIGMQFIRPERNVIQKNQEENISHRLQAPGKVKAVLKISCYDCHSNNTRYPWYVSIQPIGWLMASHIKEGKGQLNFDEFSGYSGRRQLTKLKSVAGSVRDSSMPIKSYTWMHADAKLSPENKALIIEWAIKMKDSIEAGNRLNK